MSACAFCRIVAGEIPAKVLFSDDDVLAFHDISPRAPVHVLVIPRRHVTSLSEASADDQSLLGKLLLGASEVARRMNIVEGYRVVANTGRGAGQTVFHLHLHVLGGRNLGWPPG